MIILGVILLVIGLVAGISILWTIVSCSSRSALFFGSWVLSGMRWAVDGTIGSAALFRLPVHATTAISSRSCETGVLGCRVLFSVPDGSTHGCTA